MRAKILIAAGCAAVGLWTAVAARAQDFPDKAVRFIVPFNPGGSYDTVARMIGQELTSRWKQQVVIENRPGSGSLIGTELASRAPADGYTMVIFGNNHAILPSVHRKASFDSKKDFQPVILVAKIPALLLVNPSVPAQTVSDLIKLAREKPGKLNFGSGGNGSATHLGLEMFKHVTGTEIVHIPYKAGVPATMDLIAGETQVGLLDVLSARAHVESGKLRPLAITATERSPFFPTVPTMAEAGVPAFNYVEWYGIVVPAGTPRPVVETMNKDVAQVIATDHIKDRLQAMGAVPMTSTPEEFAKFFSDEIDKNAQAVKQAGVKVD
jgi:tripartite-type tricarboxylate transporter receptor subunit TctC